MTQSCLVEECERMSVSRGWCSMHYLRWRRNGDPLIARISGGFIHGLSNSPTFRSWWDMVRRCTQPTRPGFANYGGRGITVCDRWRVFANFLADMGERPEGLTLDRRDNDGNYEPGNCRWATHSEQQRNKRPTSEETKQRQALATQRTWAEKGYQLCPHGSTSKARCPECVRARAYVRYHAKRQTDPEAMRAKWRRADAAKRARKRAVA